LILLDDCSSHVGRSGDVYTLTQNITYPKHSTVACFVTIHKKTAVLAACDKKKNKMEKPIAVRTVAVFPHEAGQAVQLRLHGLHSVRHEALVVVHSFF